MLKVIIRELEPFSILSERQLEELSAHASIIEFPPGDRVYAEGDDDGFANIVLDGEADRYVARKRLAAGATGTGERASPTDNPGPKQHTLVARTRLRVLRLLRGDLDRALAAAQSGTDEEALSVSDIERDDSEDWMTRFLRSALFRKLSAGTIEKIFSRMAQVDQPAGTEVVRQGERSAYFYVIESGHCEVVRRPAPSRPQVQLAVLGPGDSFGEEAIVSDEPRNATVRMLGDGKLMRLEQEDFRKLLVQPLVQGLNHRQARWMIEQGAVWMDNRDREAFRQRAFEGAENIPHEVLRIGCRKLDPDTAYIVCNDNVKTSRLGAFLMAQAGHDVYYLDESMKDIPDSSPNSPSDQPSDSAEEAPPQEAAGVEDARAAEAEQRLDVDTPVPVPDEPDTLPDDIRTLLEGPPPPLPRDQYADTMVGIELANLIDELDERHQDLTPGKSRTDDRPTVINPAVLAGELGGGDDDELIAEPPAGTSGATPPAADAGGSGSSTGSDSMAGGDFADDELNRILAATDARIRDYITSTIAGHRARLEQQLAERVAEVRRSAGQVLAERTRVIQEKYETAYSEKERVLRRDYERLMALAGKMSHQKAEIQRKRKDLEMKLNDADRLYREVAQIGGSLIDDIGEIEDIEPSRAFSDLRH